jgi:RHS repeat-associated protein
VTYPDGEVVTNGYDAGGLLSAISGTWTSGGVTQSSQYLKRLEYDEFGYRRYQETGNGVKTSFTYDPKTRRLMKQVTNTPAREVQDLNYTYDLVGNVKKLDNQLPAAVPNLFLAPNSQEYTYDPYYRIATGKGTYSLADKKRRDYDFTATYDTLGNVKTKNQTDTIFGSSKQGNPVTETTYKFDPIAYKASKPHQISQIGGLSYQYDDNGALTGITDPKGAFTRKVGWDAAGRARQVSNGADETDFTYDDSGALRIERGKQGETVFVNHWYSVRSGNQVTKHIWADDDRLVTQLVGNLSPGAIVDHRNYFLHKDLQGSTNVVTDDAALVFQHYEYFPSGEPWIVEQSTQYRTPYLFTGAYSDEFRKLTNHGQRWYEPREMTFYSPEPMLADEPDQVVDDPALLTAYTYAESNPLRLVDLTGRQSSGVTKVPKSTAVLGASKVSPPGATRSKGYRYDDDVISVLSSLRSSRVTDWQFELAISSRADKIAKFSERFEGRALITINVGDLNASGPKALGRLFTGLKSIKSVKFGLPFHKGRIKIETKAGLAEAAQKAIAANQAAAQTPSPTVGAAAGGNAGGANGSPAGAPAAPSTPGPAPASSAKTAGPPNSTKN